MKTVARSVIAQRPAPTESNPKAAVEFTLEGPILLNIDNNEEAPSVQEWIMDNLELIKQRNAIPGTIQIMTTTIPTTHHQNT